VLDLLKKYRTPLLSGCLVLLALLVYSGNLRHRGGTGFFARVVLQLTAPVQVGADAIWGLLDGGWDRYFRLVNTQEENTRLLHENRELHAEIARLAEVNLANDRLRRLLDFKITIDLPTVPAQVIAEDASSWFRTVVIDKGESNGLHEGLPVVVAEGAAGRIIACAPHQARVLLLSDTSSAVAALVQRNRTRGIIRGHGDILLFEYVVSQADIEIGDEIVTSGTGGIFPKGLPIGRVTRVTRVSNEEYGLFQTVEVVPYVDFARLEEVMVILEGPK
jgi:rod shape-determining protein MreC